MIFKKLKSCLLEKGIYFYSILSRGPHGHMVQNIRIMRNKFEQKVFGKITKIVFF